MNAQNGAKVTLFLGAIAACLTAGCDRSENNARAEAARSAPIQAQLLAALRARVSERLPEPTIETIRLIPQASEIASDLHYVWGVYTPPNSQHVVHLAIVGSQHGSVRVLDTPQDWASLVREWEPRSEDEVIRACMELLHVVGPRRSLRPPEVYLGARSLEHMLSPLDDASRLSAPSVAKNAQGEWNADLWVAVPGALEKYHCGFGPHGRVVLEAVDSIPGAGQLPR